MGLFKEPAWVGDKCPKTKDGNHKVKTVGIDRDLAAFIDAPSRVYKKCTKCKKYWKA